MKESVKKMMDKDTDKLNKQFAKGKIYIEGIVREQKEIIKTAEKGMEEMSSRINSLEIDLKPYVEDEKELDDKFKELKTEYQDCVMNKLSLQRAILVASESIEEAKLNYFP